MNFNLSDIVYPNYVTGIQDVYGEWLKGGYDYQTQMPAWIRYFVVKDVREFNLADYSWHERQGGGLESDWYPIFTLPNGYEIRAKFEFTQLAQQNQYFYGVQLNWFDLDGNSLGNDHVGDAGFRGFASASGYYPINYGNMNDGTFSSYIILDTMYYPDANPPAGSVNHGLALMFLVGSTEYGYHVEPGSGPIGRDGGGIASISLTWSDLQLFATYLHSNGNPFEGDPFTDEEFPGEPAGSEDTSTTGGGGGTYDDTSDPIDFPSLPTGGALECGAVYAHHISKASIEVIITKLWNNSIFDPVAMWQKSLDNPFDAIVSLHCLPVVPQEAADPNDLYIGNFNTELSSIPKVTSQYIAIDCGSLNVKEYWGSALDYSPYTRAEIYLPFIGVRDIAIEDVMNYTIAIRYHVDVLTGDCIAFIKCGLSVLYHFKGNCRMTVPLSAQTTDALQNTIGETGKLLATAAIGGAVGGAPAALAGATISAAANVASSKIRTSKGGDVSGSMALMDDFVPYLILHRPVQSLAKDYNKFKGYPSNITSNLGNLKGYTEVEHIHLQGIPNATSEEMDEIVNILKNGIII